MATLEKDPMTGAYIVKSGDTLSKIASTQGRTLQELLASNPQYASNPNLIRPGQTVNFGSSTQPPAPRSYADLTSSTPAPQSPTMPYLPGVSPEPTQTSNPTTSFTKALIDILKNAQGTNQTGQAKLMKQGQDIKGQGLADSARNFNNPNLAPNSGTSLGLSAQNEFDPSTLSIENQQKLATTNLGNITDIIDRTQSSYDKEQERIAQAKQDIADAEFKQQQLAEQIRSNKAGERIAGQKAGSGGGNSNQMTDNERALFNQFNSEPIVKDYNTILSKKLTVDQILNSKLGGPGDLAIVYEFMKGLDPSSVVRESEYQSAAQSGNIFAGALARFNGYLKPDGGFLPDAVKNDFQSIVGSKLKVQTQLYDNVASQYQQIASRQGLNPSNVTLNYSAANINPASTNISSWLTDYNYDKDLADAKAAIKAGADKAAIKQQLLQKYKQVDL